MGLWPPVLDLGPAHGIGHRYFHKCTDFVAVVTCTFHTSFSTKARRPRFWGFRKLGCCQDERAERGCRAEWDRDLLQTPVDTHPHLLGLTQKPPSDPPWSFTASCAHTTLRHPSTLSSFQPPPRFLPRSCSLLSISVKHKPGPLPLLLRTCYGSPVPPGESWGFSHSGGGPVCSAPPPDPLSYHQWWPCELSRHPGPHCLQGPERGFILCCLCLEVLSKS